MLGVFLIASAASAVQSDHPAVYAFSALFLMPAVAVAFTDEKVNYYWAVREKKDAGLYENYYWKYLQKTYYENHRKKPVLFWMGYLAMIAPLVQSWF